MQAGKMRISRGLAAAEAAPPPRLHAVPPAPAPAIETTAPDSALPDHMLVEHRLSALERLSQLLERGVLTAQEFAAEKALVLRLPADELVLPPEAPAPRTPSLLGRLFGWKLVAAGVAAGLAFSAYTSPQAFDDLLRFFH